MLTEAFTLLLQLPPLAFGPVQPLRAYDMPRELVCSVWDLGRIQEPAPLRWSFGPTTALDPRGLQPQPERHFVNPAVEFLLVMGALASTRGGWDDRSWATRRWDAMGTVTPVLIPPQAPPVWSQAR